MDKKSGMNYAPSGKPNKVVRQNEFVIAATALDHGHIYGMVNGLTEAGAHLKWVYDKDTDKVRSFMKQYPGVKAADSLDQILSDSEVKMVAGAAVASERLPLGLRVMGAGKDYFTDKAPLTTLEQLELAKQAVRKTKQKYMVYYSERLHSESAVYAGNLIKDGAIGRVIQVIGLGPHRLNAADRPEWFFQKEKYGGILCDIGSHQIEQYLYFADVKDAKIVSSQIANYNHPEYDGLDDFGECLIKGDNGTTNYFRVDWFTPDALPVWGDGRTIILGTDGYIELRKYIDVGRTTDADHVLLVNNSTVSHILAAGTVGYPFFGELILDCLNRTENAMTQEHAFKAAELSIKAQLTATELKPYSEQLIKNN